MSELDRALGRTSSADVLSEGSGLPFVMPPPGKALIIPDAPPPAPYLDDAFSSSPIAAFLEGSLYGQSQVELLGESDSESTLTRVIFLMLIFMLGTLIKYFVSSGFYDLLCSVCSTLSAIEHEGRDLPNNQQFTTESKI